MAFSAETIPHLPLFNTSYADAATLEAFDKLLLPKLVEKLRLKNIDVFCAFQNDNVDLRFPGGFFFDSFKDGKHILLMDVCVKESRLMKRDYEKSRAVADAIVERFHEILDTNPSVHKYSHHDNEIFMSEGACIDGFYIKRHQLRQMAETLGCVKEFDQIAAKDDARRAEAQEYVKAAEKVLSKRLLKEIKIAEIKESFHSISVRFPKPTVLKFPDEAFKSILFDEKKDIIKFYEDVIYERNAALSPMPRAAFDLTNKLGRLLGSPKLR